MREIKFRAWDKNKMHYFDLEDTIAITNQLFGWRFDVFGLIEKGLAIKKLTK